MWNYIVALLVLHLCLFQVKEKRESYIAYCDIVKSANDYDNKSITVRASFRYGFEVQELFCTQCRKIGKTWVEFDEDNIKQINSALKKTPKNAGTINGVFSGTFRSLNGPYGDGGYRFMFKVKVLEKVEVVSKSGWDPETLPDEVKNKLCTGV
jgi:hypothetical protein